MRAVPLPGRRHCDAVPTVADGAVQQGLGVTKPQRRRSQLTYLGQPLYYYSAIQPPECHRQASDGVVRRRRACQRA